jgi:hypothetical protein
VLALVLRVAGTDGHYACVVTASVTAAGSVDTNLIFYTLTVVVMVARGTGLTVISLIARIAATNRRTTRIVTRPVITTGRRLTSRTGNASAINIRIPRQAVAANRKPLVVFALAVLTGTVGVVSTGVDRPALTVTVIRIARITETATVSSVAGITATDDGSCAVVAGAVQVTGICLATLTRYLRANVLYALESLCTIGIYTAIDTCTCYADT